MVVWVTHQRVVPAVERGHRAEAQRALGQQKRVVSDAAAVQALWAARALGAFAGVLEDERSNLALREIDVTATTVLLSSVGPPRAVHAVALHEVGSDTVEVRFVEITAPEIAGADAATAGPVSEKNAPPRHEGDEMVARVVLQFVREDRSRIAAESEDEGLEQSIRLTRFVVGTKEPR